MGLNAPDSMTIISCFRYASNQTIKQAKYRVVNVVVVVVAALWKRVSTDKTDLQPYVKAVVGNESVCCKSVSVYLFQTRQRHQEHGCLLIKTSFWLFFSCSLSLSVHRIRMGFECIWQSFNRKQLRITSCILYFLKHHVNGVRFVYFVCLLRRIMMSDRITMNSTNNTEQRDVMQIKLCYLFPSYMGIHRNFDSDSVLIHYEHIISIPIRKSSFDSVDAVRIL